MKKLWKKLKCQLGFHKEIQIYSFSSHTAVPIRNMCRDCGAKITPNV